MVWTILQSLYAMVFFTTLTAVITKNEGTYFAFFASALVFMYVTVGIIASRFTRLMLIEAAVVASIAGSILLSLPLGTFIVFLAIFAPTMMFARWLLGAGRWLSIGYGVVCGCILAVMYTISINRGLKPEFDGMYMIMILIVSAVILFGRLPILANSRLFSLAFHALRRNK